MRPGRIEILWFIRAEDWGQGAADQNVAVGTGIGSFPRQTAGQFDERSALALKSFLADVEWHQRIGIGGDHVSAGIYEFGMNLTDNLGAFHQSQSRPFGLHQPGAKSGQFTAHASIENLDGPGHVKLPSCRMAGIG